MGVGLGTSFLRAWAEQGDRKLTHREADKQQRCEAWRAGTGYSVCAPLPAPAPPLPPARIHTHQLEILRNNCASA